MTTLQIITATMVWLVLTAIVFTHSNWAKIRSCFAVWLTRAYWTDYNLVEFFSYLAKVLIIVPGLVFAWAPWWLYFLTLVTSLTLIWASNKKLLPTLVGFNLVWAWISCMVLAKHLV